jgi:hypothetical protein
MEQSRRPRTRLCPFVFATAIVGMGLSKRTGRFLSKTIRVRICRGRAGNPLPAVVVNQNAPVGRRSARRGLRALPFHPPVPQPGKWEVMSQKPVFRVRKG